MESSDDKLGSPLAGNFSGSQNGEHSTSVLPHSEDDEFLLFQMSHGNDILSPTSKRIIEENTVPFTPAPHATERGAPLAIQRPSSSGFEAMNFNYAKPTQTDVTFSFHVPSGRMSKASKRRTSGTPKQIQRPMRWEGELVQSGKEQVRDFIIFATMLTCFCSSLAGLNQTHMTQVPVDVENDRRGDLELSSSDRRLQANSQTGRHSSIKQKNLADAGDGSLSKEQSRDSQGRGLETDDGHIKRIQGILSKL